MLFAVSIYTRYPFPWHCRWKGHTLVCISCHYRKYCRTMVIGQLAKYIHSNSFMLDTCQLYCVSNGSMGYPFLAASETKTLNGKPSSGLCRKACLFYWWPLVICHRRCILVSSSSGSLLWCWISSSAWSGSWLVSQRHMASALPKMSLLQPVRLLNWCFMSSLISFQVMELAHQWDGIGSYASLCLESQVLIVD